MPDVFLHNKLSTHSFLHAFCTYPRIRFETQHDHETVALAIRAHPFTQIPWIVISIIGLFLPLIIDAFILFDVPATTLFFVNIFWFMLIITFIFYKILCWIFNVGIVTNERVLDVDYRFATNEMTEAAAYDVTDVTFRSSGFFAQLFNYGDIFIQTAGTNQNIEFLRVPRPGVAVTIISESARSSHGNTE